jgi:4-amino-4-deoxy-L-arabinose transferase-like glycosyltransferase
MSEPTTDWKTITVVGLIGLGACYLLIGGLGSYPLWDPWEPKYGQAMREMFERSDFITPYLDGEIRWTKPILYYWAMLVPMTLWGDNEFTARLPSALAAIVAILFLYHLLSTLYDRWTGIMGACVLGTLPQFYFMARQAMPDMLLTAFLALAMGSYALAVFGHSHRRRWFLVFYASVSLAFLTKGPVAIAITLGALLTFWIGGSEAVRSRTGRGLLKELKTTIDDHQVVLGLAIFLAISSPWYLTMLVKYGPDYIDAFWGWENIERFRVPIRSHHGSVTYYFRALFHGMYPWIGLLPVSLVFLFHGNQSGEDRRQRWYFFSWVAATFLIFSAAGTKLQHYLLPITPSIAVLVALAWRSYLSKEPPAWVRSAFLISVGFVFLPIRDFLVESSSYIFGAFTNRRSIRLIDVDVELMTLMVTWTLIMVAAFFLRRSRVVALSAVLAAFAHGVFFCHYVLPAESPRWNLNVYVNRYITTSKPGSELVSYGKRRYSLDFNYPQIVIPHFRLGEEASLVDLARAQSPLYLICEKDHLDVIAETLARETQREWTTDSRRHPRYALLRDR